jgi:hypothetical protein
MINQLVIPIGGMVALAAASIYYAEPQPDQPAQLAQAPAAPTESSASSQAAPAGTHAAPAIKVSQAVAASNGALSIAALPDPAPQKVAAVQTAEEKETIASALRSADKEMQPAGFGAACFDQMRGFFCPIIGRLPGFREMAAQVATLGGFSCPMGAPPATGS